MCPARPETGGLIRLWPWALLAVFVFDCSGAVRGEEPEEPCVVKSGERVSIRDPRLLDMSCVIEVGAVISLQWDEYTDVAIKKATVTVTPSCSDPSRGVALEQTARAKVTALQSMPIEIERIEKPCADRAKVDVIIVETGL